MAKLSNWLIRTARSTRDKLTLTRLPANTRILSGNVSLQTHVICAVMSYPLEQYTVNNLVR